MKKISVGCMLIMSVLCSFKSSAQLSGIYTIPGSYSSLASAISALNTSGVSGPVTVNIAAGYSETAPAGGYLLGTTLLNASLSSAKTLTIQKSGAGANPLFTASTGTSLTSDGIFKIAGADYVTISNISLRENPSNTTPTTGMEFGFAFVNLNASAPFDGCNHDMIMNCSITMNNSILTTEAAIYSAHHVAGNTTALAITSVNDTHSDNKFYGNTITNCMAAISLSGYNAASPYTLYDQNNDIGGATPLTGNTITNFTGYSASRNVINATNQQNLNISNNNLDQLANGGSTAAFGLNGINTSGVNSTFAVSKNIISLSTTAALSYTLNGIVNNSAGIQMTANDNKILLTVPSGAVQACNGVNATSTRDLTLTGNRINIQCNTTGVGAGYGLLTAATNNLRIIRDTITINNGSGGAGSYDCILAQKEGLSEVIQDNVFLNCSVQSTRTQGTIILIQSLSTTTNKNISGNSISGSLIHNGSSTGHSTVCIAVTPMNTITGGTLTVSNNDFTNISATGGSVSGIQYYSLSPSTQSAVIDNNTISNVSLNSSFLGIDCEADDMSLQDFTISNNTISGISGVNSFFYGITAGAANNVTINNNYIKDMTASGTGGIAGIAAYGDKVITENISNNRVCNLQSGSGIIRGVWVQGGATVNVWNNLIGNLTSPAANRATPSVRGIDISSIQANSDVNVYFNAVYLNTSSTGTEFSSAGISHTADASATTAALDLRNNIIVDNSIPSGSGFATALYRTGASLSNYKSISNNNLFYGGVSGAAHYIYYNGTTGYQTLAGFKTAVSPRESASVTENPPFSSVTCGAASFLRFAAGTPTVAESAGVYIPGYDRDIDGNLRAGSPGYTGSGTAPDLGAGEGNFTAVVVALRVLHLNGIRSGESNLLVWEVQSAQQDEHLILQRSEDGNIFKDIYSVTGGTGKYTFTDQSFASDVNYYRVKSAATNSDVKFSNIIVLKKQDQSNISLWPNPVKNELNIFIPFSGKSTEIRLFDINGKPMFIKSITEHFVKIDMSSYSAGTYFIRTQGKTKSVIKK